MGVFKDLGFEYNSAEDGLEVGTCFHFACLELIAFFIWESTAERKFDLVETTVDDIAVLWTCPNANIFALLCCFYAHILFPAISLQTP